MPAAPMALSLRRIASTTVGDAELLAAFRTQRDEAAFAELVRRYGPLVAGVCRRALGQQQDAEDAFQAAFLVLARKAQAVASPDRLAGWLHTVALRAAQEVRSMRQRQRRSDSARPRPEAVASATPDSDLAAVLDEELSRLPDHYRMALLRCELQGQSRIEAAAALGIPEGTLSSRLAEAKRRLARRLRQRGVSAGAAGLTAVFASQADAGLLSTRPTALARAAVAAVCGARVGSAASRCAVAAADVVVKTTVASKLKGLALIALALTVLGGGLTLVPSEEPAARAAEPMSAPRPAAADVATLIERLGSARYGEREQAQRQLRDLGGKARAAVRAGTTSADPEVARRCRELLPVIRVDEWDRARAALKADRRDIDHPVWQRFKEIAGDDAASRKLFLEMIADEKRAKLLDESHDEPAGTGPLYAAEVKRVAYLAEFGVSKAPDLAAKGMVVGALEYHSSNGELAALLFLGSEPATARVVPDDGRGERFLLYNSVFKMGMGKDVLPAVRRLLAAWTGTRGNAGAIDAALDLGKEWWVTEMLPVARRLAADDKQPPAIRAEAILALGQMGDRGDLPLLRRIAESRGADQPFDQFNVILKGREQFDALWGRERLGGQKPTPEEWKKAYAQADIRRGALALADCAWAAAIKVAGGKPGELGFLWRWRLTGHLDDFPPHAHAFGFPDERARTAAITSARAWLDERAKAKK